MMVRMIMMALFAFTSSVMTPAQAATPKAAEDASDNVGVSSHPPTKIRKNEVAAKKKNATVPVKQNANRTPKKRRL